MKPSIRTLLFAVVAMAFDSSSSAGTLDCSRPMLLLTWDSVGSTEKIYRIDPEDPSDPGVGVSISGVASNDLPQVIQVDVTTGQIFTVTALGNLGKLDPDTGVVTLVGSLGITPTPPDYLGFDPVTRDLLLIDALNKQWVIDPLTATVVTTRPDVAYGPSDVHFGATLWASNFVYTNDFPGATSSKLLLLDLFNQTLGEVGGVGPSVLSTIGYIGINASQTYALAQMPNGMLYVAGYQTTFQPNSRMYRVDPDTGVSTYVGSLPAGTDWPLDLCFEFDPLATDSDCDGYPNAIEDLVGASRYVSTDTPFPAASGAPTATAAPALATKLKIDLDFANVANDRLVMKGSIPVGGSTFEPEGQRVIVDVGGKLFAFTLDAKGKGNDGAGARIRVAKKVIGGNVFFALTAKDIDLQTDLSDDGLTNTTTTNASVSIDVAVWMTNLHGKSTKPMHYTATTGGHGKAS